MSLEGPWAEVYVFAVLTTVLVLFLRGRWRYDVVALVALLAVGLADVLPRERLFLGFGHPAVVTVAAVLVVERGLTEAGVVTLVVGEGLPSSVAVAVVVAVTMVLTNVINNATATVLLAPVAIDLAGGLGVSPDPFLMAVAVGASCAFLTPIGHQSNTLVLGPGGYRFGDFWRLGLPLSLLVVVLAGPLITWAWPL